MERQTGNYILSSLNGQAYKAFVPAPLPPLPPLQLDHALVVLRDRALVALGELKGITRILPDARLFLYQYVRKEALLSSQIEGTQSSLSDLLLFELDEAPGVPLDDVREVSNYMDALEHGLSRLRGEFPLSLRLLREMHEHLLRRGRGSSKAPGEFRKTPVWIGGPSPDRAQFVPPPADALLECLDALERFLHATEDGISPLARAGLAHVQFETIHPFLDGNGRLGRLLIVLMLCDAGLLDEPSLYLSLYFKSRRDEYYQRLDAVRTQGDWEGWLRFFFDGVAATSGQAVDTAQRLLRLFQDDRERLRATGRIAGTVLQLHEAFTRNPLRTIPRLVDESGLSKPAISRGLDVMRKLGIIREITGKQRYMIFAYQPYLDILSEGAQPL
ncbi:Fic family protein [Pseudoxanthomonas sp.]|jgi:Fic family protein|uniref:Fic family protein n=1 Tax=Pseudoxanthomonas sp. TaxID=1871049 RepID=UPI002E11CB88|nr:Fic family protein [Pseudoxanthomonas sp.]